jgi:aminomethyltransferase
MSPTLEIPIGMASVPPGHGVLGSRLEVAIRASRIPAEVVPLPFYRRPA